MNRKQLCCLLLALALIAAFFTGCAGNTTQAPADNAGQTAPADTGSAQTETTEPAQTETTEPAQTETTEPAQTETTEPAQTETTEPAQTETTEPAEEDTGYKFAAGKVVWDGNWPTTGYDYETPFCTTGETLTYWTVCYTPQYLPDEGLDGIDFRIEEQRRTGVDIEYLTISTEARAESFATLLAADDLPDLMNQADSYYPGTEAEAIEEGWFANIFDYKEYAPNYLHYIHEHMDEDVNLYDQTFLNNHTITKFMHLENIGGLDASLIGIRADWLDKLGIDKDTIDTIPEIEEVCELFRSEMGATYPLSVIFEPLDTDSYLGCFNTYTRLSTSGTSSYPSPNLVDGKVNFFFSNDDARNYVETIAGWVAKGYESPNWMSFGMGYDAPENVSNSDNGITGISVMPYSTITTKASTSNDPDCRWELLKKPSLYEGQVHHLGIRRGLCNGFGKTHISASCANIPLAVTWCDWRYCPEGSDLAAWGLEGTLWEIGEDGQRVATEWAYNNPEGQNFGFIKCMYSQNFLAEHGLGDGYAVYSYPGGYAVFDAFAYWYDVPYDGAYEWPRGVQLDAEQSNEFMRYADMDTFIAENVQAFVTGEKPLSEWDSYVATLESMGLREAEAIYQEAYDDYLARKNA